MLRMSGYTAGVTKRLGVLAGTLLIAAAEAHAQDQQTTQAKSASQAATLPSRRIVISIADRKLAWIQDGRVLKTYAVAVGAEDSPSPVGEFKIAQRIRQPAYYSPGVVIPPGKNNPLGPGWLGLTRKGFGIHGTNEPRSIGRNTSHGCIRLRNQDIEELFELVRVGDVVELHAAPGAGLAQILGASSLPATVDAAAASDEK